MNTESIDKLQDMLLNLSSEVSIVLEKLVTFPPSLTTTDLNYIKDTLIKLYPENKNQITEAVNMLEAFRQTDIMFDLV